MSPDLSSARILVVGDEKDILVAARLLLKRHLVGTLDDPNKVSPESTICTSMAPAWAAIDPNLPRLTGQPPLGGRRCQANAPGDGRWCDTNSRARNLGQ
jgi:hypothetical protein